MALSVVLEGAGQGLDWAFPTACCLSVLLCECVDELLSHLHAVIPMKKVLIYSPFLLKV